MDMSKRTYAASLAAVFVVALLLRLGAASVFVGLGAGPDAEANPDQLDYELFAARMAAGEGYTLADGSPTARRAPGTSLTLLPAYVMFGHDYAAGRVWMCLISAATCLAAAWITTQCFARGAGVVAAAVMAFHPGHFYYAMHFVSEGPFVLWLTLATGCTIHALKRRDMRCDIVAGVCWAMAVLTRPHLVLLIPLGLLVVLLARGRRLSAMTQWSVQVAVIALLLSPWVIRNGQQLGKPTIATVGGHTFWGGNNELVAAMPGQRGRWMRTSRLSERLRALPATEVAADEAAWRYGIEYVTSRPLQAVGLAGMKLWRFVEPNADTSNAAVRLAFALAWIVIAPLAVLGLSKLWREQRGHATCVALPIAATLATVLIFYGSTRFRHSLVSLLVVVASAPVATAITWLAQRAMPYRTTSRYEYGRPLPFPQQAETEARRAA